MLAFIQTSIYSLTLKWPAIKSCRQASDFSNYLPGSEKGKMLLCFSKMFLTFTNAT